MMKRKIIKIGFPTVLILFMAFSIVLAAQTTIYLKTSQKDSPFAKSLENNEGCGPGLTNEKPYGWHFILSPLTDDTGYSGQFMAKIDGVWMNGVFEKETGGAQHYWAYTSTAGTLNDAKVTINDAVLKKNHNGKVQTELKLSHTCTDSKEIPEYPTAALPALIALGGYLAIRRFRS